MAETAPAPHDQAPAPASVEDSDIDVRIVLIPAGILILVIGCTCWGVWVLFQDHVNQAREEEQARQTLAEIVHEHEANATLKERPLDKRLPPGPTLEGLATPPAVGNPLPLVRGLGPTADVGKPIMSGVQGWPSLGPEQAAREEQELSKLSWVNEEEGIVRLPIEKVMKELAGTLPARSSDPVRDRTPHYRMPSGASSGRPAVGGKP